ncbi:hypothetical protein JL193_10255 [Polaribacter batillariae]|uniref:Uncharacterized protein n=1 Tax=Polaribacter batillariae TaxID=2808900 RepID=A0ABX7SQN1_9FLAO|nr:hypothetical protein [Polaribacter batillariae]QTD36530.1 hypothetical protein JL193_10255 [Polaribacter batillariae]
MEVKATTYRTLSGTKQIIEIPKKQSAQWVIYEDNKPKYFVDCFKLEIESNAIMNNLVLCNKESIEEVLQKINKRNNINLSIPKISRIGFKKKLKSVSTNLDLQPIPEKWLDYSL